MGKAKKRKRFWPSQSSSFAIRDCETTKFDQPRLLWMQRERECFHPRFEFRQKRSSVSLVLKTADDVVGVSHDYHVTASMAFPPLLHPQIKDIVKVDRKSTRLNSSHLG